MENIQRILCALLLEVHYPINLVLSGRQVREQSSLGSRKLSNLRLLLLQLSAAYVLCQMSLLLLRSQRIFCT